jgi:benzoate transport
VQSGASAAFLHHSGTWMSEKVVGGAAARIAASIAPESHEDEAVSGFPLRAILICTVLHMLDGFDVLVMSFVAPAVSETWKLSGSQLGFLFSVWVVGATSGSLLVAPLGDRLGRRPISVLCLSVITLGMLLSAFARNAAELGMLRLVTGIGVGGLVPTLNVITAEYAPARWRGAALGLQATGYPIGATLGGWIAILLITHYGWQAAFLFGGLMSALMLPVVVCCIPESMDFLIARPPGGALERFNALRHRMRLPPIGGLPQQCEAPTRARWGLAWGLPTRSAVPFSLAFFLTMLGISFVQSWTPKLLIDGGLSAEQGLTAGVILNLGGIVGGVLVSCCAARVAMRELAIGFLALGAFSMVVFGMALPSQLVSPLGTALVMGVSLSSAIIGLVALGPSLYPPQVRATGMGLSVGAGRIGAIVAPLIAGALLDAGWQAAHLYYVFAVPTAVALLSVRALARP